MILNEKEFKRCLVYDNENFKYNFGVNISMIVLSSLALVANIFLIFSYGMTLCYRSKSKSSSLDILFLILTIVECIISIYWIINSSYFFYGHKGKEFGTLKCESCQQIALFGIFIYCFDWTLLTTIIYHLKETISNPISTLFQSKKKLITYLVFCSIVSLIAVMFAYLGNYNGINPMFTCFVDTNLKLANKTLINFVVSIILFSSFMAIPLSNFFYGLYHSIVILKNIKAHKDTEAQHIYNKYILHFLIYIISTFFLFILHISDIPKHTQLDNIFINFSYVRYIVHYSLQAVSIMNCSTPLIVGLFRLAQKHTWLFHKVFDRKYQRLSELPTTIPIENDNSDYVELMKKGSIQFERLENQSMKRMMRDILVSICYSINKSKEDSKQSYSLAPSHFKETNNFQITMEKISEDYNCPLKDDIVIKESTTININVFEYSPKVFSYLRKLDQINPDQIINSFLPSNNQQGISESQGRSGNFFINTDDKKFILKTINYEDLELIKQILLEKITNHFNDNKNSIIGRIYGIYTLIIPTGFFKQDEVIFILMRNVCDIFDEQILGKYDIKGSKLDRRVTVNVHTISNKVMKDNNFEEIEMAFVLSEKKGNELLRIVKEDAKFFYQLGIMDYSLLVVKIKLNEDEMKYLFGLDHRKVTETEYLELAGVNSIRTSTNSEIESINNRPINTNNIRFDINDIKILEKYIYPSLFPDVMYIFSIIDFFQLYDIKKNLETKMKRIWASKAIISSAPPQEYYQRFIKDIESKVDAKKLFDDMRKRNTFYEVKQEDYQENF